MILAFFSVVAMVASGIFSGSFLAFFTGAFGVLTVSKAVFSAFGVGVGFDSAFLAEVLSGAV